MAAEPSFEKSTFSWIWDSVDVTTEELARFQPEWDIPGDIVVEADVGHRTSFDEAVRYGIDCARAGASSLHMHIRDEHDQEVGDPGVWREAIDRIQAEVGEIGINRGLRGTELRESLSTSSTASSPRFRSSRCSTLPTCGRRSPRCGRTRWSPT